MLARLRHAYNLLVAESRPHLAVASGGRRGTSGSKAGPTEAYLTEQWLMRRGIRKVYRDDLAQETIGNLVFTYVGLLLPLGIQRVTFVTDQTHSGRVQRLADHILGGLVEVFVSSPEGSLLGPHATTSGEIERNGAHFVDALIRDVPPADPHQAFEWVAATHRDHPYRSWTLGLVQKHFQGYLISHA
jgi:uncharacterized SAM-binding protein YcdF (DUF218 family)